MSVSSIVIFISMLLVGSAGNVVTEPATEYVDKTYAGATMNYAVGGMVDRAEGKLDGHNTDMSPDERWNKTFGGTGNDHANSIQQTSDGGYIMAGSTDSYRIGDCSHGWLIKTNARGIEQWNRTFGSEGGGSIYSVQQTLGGGYILAGSTFSFDNMGDAWLIKTNNVGDMQWDRTFGGKGRDSISSVQQTLDGGYIMAGGTESYGAGHYNGWMIKTDENGNEQWKTVFFSGNTTNSVSHVQQTSDGGYILAGMTYLEGDFEPCPTTDAGLLKTGPNGTEQWNRTFGGTGEDMISFFQQTFDGGYVMIGYTNSGGGDYDAGLIKTDAEGGVQWNLAFGGIKSDFAYAVQPTADGGYIFVGHTESYGAELSDAWLVKVGGGAAETTKSPTANSAEKVWVSGISRCSDQHL